MDILIINLLSESFLDFGKGSNGKYTNTRGPMVHCSSLDKGIIME